MLPVPERTYVITPSSNSEQDGEDCVDWYGAVHAVVVKTVAQTASAAPSNRMLLSMRLIITPILQETQKYKVEELRAVRHAISN